MYGCVYGRVYGHVKRERASKREKERANRNCFKSKPNECIAQSQRTEAGHGLDPDPEPGQLHAGVGHAPPGYDHVYGRVYGRVYGCVHDCVNGERAGE